MTQQEGIARYLKACRHDIAHLNGSSETDITSWVAANQAEGLTRYTTALNAAFAESGDGVEAAERALVAVKQWAQGAHYRQIT